MWDVEPWLVFLFVLVFVVLFIVLAVLAVFLLRLTGRWLDRVSGSRESAVVEAYQRGWNAAVDQAGRDLYRQGAEAADRRWRAWYVEHVEQESGEIQGMHGLA